MPQKTKETLGIRRREKSVSLNESNSVDRRQIRGNRLPRVSGIFTDPDRTGCRSKGETVTRFVDIQAVPVNEIVRPFLRESAPKSLERFSSIASAIHNDTSVDWTPLLVFMRRNKPRGVGIVWIDGYGKSEDRRFDIFNFRPGTRTIDGFKDSVVMLDPENLWI